MDIRQFAQLCQRAADGDDCRAMLPADQAGLAPLVRMARDHRVLPLLAAAMGQPAAQAAAIPWLLTPLHHTTRNMRIKAQLLDLDRALDGSGKYAILMKGAVGLFDLLYRDIGARHMADVDLLLPDAAVASTFHRLGYAVKDPAYQDRRDAAGRLRLQHGGFHLAPVMRPGDLVTTEPHLLAVAPQFRHLLPADLATNVQPVNGCWNLLRPTPVNHLIVTLIHTILHDRDTLDGALLIRGLIESDRLYARLTPHEQAEVAAHFTRQGGRAVFEGWRALADWLLRNDDAAAQRCFAGRRLIAEFRWRARGYRAVFAVAMAHRALAPLNYRYWTSLTFVSHANRLLRRDFWARFFNRLGQAYKD